ncbi:hypothetical protein T492DRAFT_1106958, partial [Pavlovales sp. CCMP2436]
MLRGLARGRGAASRSGTRTACVPLRRFYTQPPLRDKLATVQNWWSSGLLDSSLPWPQQAALSAVLVIAPLPQFELAEFLAGSRGAYVSVSQLLYERRFEELSPLVSSNCLRAMEQAMLDLAGNTMRVVTDGVDFEESVQVKSAVLHWMHVLRAPTADSPDVEGTADDEEGAATGRGTDIQRDGQWVQLDVRFEVDESFELRDELTGQPVQSEGAGVRKQKSVWKF